MEKLKVDNFIIENTGGSVYVAYGRFTNGLYFSIGCDLICVYDEDEYKAMDDDNYWEDPYEWEMSHIVELNITESQHKEILKQIYDKYECSYKDELDLFYIGLEMEN